jgi:hypothetical protein
MRSIHVFFITIILNIFFSIKVNSQNIEKSLTISYNLLKAFTNEYSLNVEYKFLKKLSAGLTLGQVHDNPDHYVFKLSPSQNNYPGLVFKGFVARTYLAYNLVSTDYYGFYISPQFLYKYLYYNNISFLDSWGDQGDNTFIRNERADLYGFDLMFGWNFFMGEDDSPVDFYLNLNWGFGIRYRHRNITTISSETRGNPGYVVPLGKEIKDQKYASSTLIGVKIGVRIKLDKEFY